jgi:hypothetical protein
MKIVDEGRNNRENVRPAIVKLYCGSQDMAISRKRYRLPGVTEITVRGEVRVEADRPRPLIRVASDSGNLTLPSFNVGV